MAATSQQRPGNALTTNIPEHSKDELQRLFTPSIAPDRQNSQKSSKALTGVKIHHADRGIKARAPKSTFQCSTR